MLYYPSIDIIKKQKIQVLIPERVTTGTERNKQPFNDAIFCGRLTKNLIKVLFFLLLLVSFNNMHFIVTSIYSNVLKKLLGKGWDKLMHAKIDSSDRRKPDIEDSESDELETEEDEDDKCLDMNIVYDEETGGDCGDGGDY